MYVQKCFRYQNTLNKNVQSLSKIWLKSARLYNKTEYKGNIQNLSNSTIFFTFCKVSTAVRWKHLNPRNVPISRQGWDFKSNCPPTVSRRWPLPILQNAQVCLLHKFRCIFPSSCSTRLCPTPCTRPQSRSPAHRYYLHNAVVRALLHPHPGTTPSFA